MISTVVLDIGETVVDDTRNFSSWASRLGVPVHTFSALVGQIRASGGETDDVEHAIHVALGRQVADPQRPYEFTRDDLYEDVEPALLALRDLGLRTILAGNQVEQSVERLRRINIPVDDIITSASLGARKPSPDYFLRLIGRLGGAPSSFMHVGDNCANDVLAAERAGMEGLHIRRGPWGIFQAYANAEYAALPSIRSLTEIASLLQVRTASGDHSIATEGIG